jgi:hypothetical protein
MPRATGHLQASRSNLTYLHKTHYRTAFKEKGKTVDRIETLPEVITVLTETVSGASLNGTIAIRVYQL